MPAVSTSKYVVNAGWDDVPHLDARSKSEMLAATPPHLRKARAKGEPSLGIKVFSTLHNWLSEFRIYRRDEHGKIIKKKDHAMDATRYLVMSGLRRAIVRPVTDVVTATGMVADPLGGY